MEHLTILSLYLKVPATGSETGNDCTDQFQLFMVYYVSTRQ
jgi:hypothetical protein